MFEDYTCPFLGDCNHKEQEQCDSEVAGEDDGRLVQKTIGALY